MKRIKILTVVTVALVIVSCCPCRRANAGKTEVPLKGTAWQLVQLDGKAFAASGENYFITFNEDGRISGKGDCNRLAGSYELSEDGKISLSQMAGTRMMCPGQQNENQFISALDGIDSYTIDGNLLILLENGDSKLVFAVKN